MTDSVSNRVIEYLQPQVCPACGEHITEYTEVDTEAPWTALNPREGLYAWGAYSADKKILHVSGQYVHIRFGDSIGDRLVRMLRA